MLSLVGLVLLHSSEHGPRTKAGDREYAVHCPPEGMVCCGESLGFHRRAVDDAGLLSNSNQPSEATRTELI